ncbi:aspartyl-phosphate phosphatase Spo0E family protein [Bacillus sp. CGMCC 1.16541]|uniref:aspartyl-phosphate phosphatase Spo0E family protein n=1 Tax=Bacillus sp. CGMCC 1.16541 TaxID=2185143 RepID=UPI000D7287F7|nr:aspartyl-phosphate phosphatase Spo0E family protein [Bacillus sp. CGMCC 1.16541]
MVTSQLLLSEIEECRRSMVRLAHKTSLSSLEVVALSTKLDFLLNEYDKQKHNEL